MRKKEFTSFDVAAVVRELNSMIIYSRISNVYQLGPKTFLLKLHKPDMQPLNLILEAGRRLNLTSYNVEKPETPPAFCMALRSRLRNASLEAIAQYEFERVVIFTFRNREGEIRFVLELFREGNIVIVDKNNEILQALTYKRMRDRNVLRGETFSFAPSTSRNPFNMNKKELTGQLQEMGEVEVVRALTRTVGIGGIYAEEILQRSRIEKTKHCNVLSENEIGSLHSDLQGLLEQVTKGVLEPLIALDESDSFVDVLPLKLIVYAEQGMKFQPYATFNEALDEFYARATAVQEATSGIEIGELKSEAERLKRMIKEQEETIAETENQAEKDKQTGDTIYTHNLEIQAILDRFSAARQSGKELSDVVQEIMKEKKAGLKQSGLFESFETRGMLAKVKINDLEFALDLHKNLYENAATFYERAKRAKQKAAGAKTALEESRNKCAEIESNIAQAETLEIAKPAEAIEELTSRKMRFKEWFEKFRWFTSSDGFLVVAGKDAVSNEVLIKKHTEPNDLVFHSEITGAPFVVIKTEGKQPTEQVLRETAEFAAAFSRGWREGFASIDVYWIKPEQLSKTAPSGEYVPHGAFIVTGKRNWMRNTPLAIAIGVKSKEDRSVEFVGGPIIPVKAVAKAAVTLAPGNDKGKELFRHIIAALAQQLPKDQRSEVAKASIEKVRELVPYGLGRLVEQK